MAKYRTQILLDTIPVTGNLVAWYSADDFYNDGGSSNRSNISVANPTTWYDRSGLGNNATIQVNGAVLTGNVKNGNSGVVFNGASWYQSGNIPRTSGSATSFIVYSKANSAASSVASWQHGDSGPYLNWYTGQGDGNTLRWESGPTPQAVNSANNTVPVGTFNVAVGRQGSAGFKWKMTASSYSYSQAGEAYASDSTAFVRIANYAGYFNGNILEIAMYDRYLSDTEVDDVYNYLRAKWNI